ncbi:hypothetical protein L3K57_15770 (plasmid) [Enterococcus faecium]|uniref:hypothetical protein n=1 Tax=Enterococcus faecium TaxID=1352 RepID=UPI001F391C9D|nr:hypothetical protein [Enterococcus faecium]UJV65262.1 hypothetical protein L3K57_15770 [Enterococcus faecium]
MNTISIYIGDEPFKTRIDEEKREYRSVLNAATNRLEKKAVSELDAYYREHYRSRWYARNTKANISRYIKKKLVNRSYYKNENNLKREAFLNEKDVLVYVLERLEDGMIAQEIIDGRN